MGPNAVRQTVQALRERGHPGVLARSGVAVPSPKSGLIPEADFERLVDQLREELTPSEAETVLARAGVLTGRYVSQHRIPAPFRSLLRWLPRRWGLYLLLVAFQRHAWTFTGRGRFDWRWGPTPAIRLVDVPTCRSCGSGRGGSFYRAAFTQLLALAAPGVRVEETMCQRRGDACCEFEIHA
ncbi:MAG: bacteriochlorophyll 4-vinyl reductase [Myxococcota bacterium]